VPVELLERVLLFYFSAPRSALLVRFERLQIDSLRALPVLLLRQLLILKAVLFVAKSGAEEAALASYAVAQERTRVAVDAVLAVREAVGAVTVHAVVQKFALEVVEAVHARSVVLEAVAVHAVLAEVRVHDEVAVLAAPGVVNVIAVLQFALHVEREGGDRALECRELFKERSGEIYLAPVRECVPFVAVPALVAVIGDRARLGKLRESSLSAEAARAGIQIKFIAERKAPLLPAVRAERRCGDGVLRSADHRGNLVVEGKVFGSDFEGCGTVGAGLPAGALAEVGFLHEDFEYTAGNRKR